MVDMGGHEEASATGVARASAIRRSMALIVPGLSSRPKALLRSSAAIRLLNAAGQRLDAKRTARYNRLSGRSH